MLHLLLPVVAVAPGLVVGIVWILGINRLCRYLEGQAPALYQELGSPGPVGPNLQWRPTIALLRLIRRYKPTEEGGDPGLTRLIAQLHTLFRLYVGSLVWLLLVAGVFFGLMTE